MECVSCITLVQEQIISYLQGVKSELVFICYERYFLVKDI